MRIPGFGNPEFEPDPAAEGLPGALANAAKRAGHLRHNYPKICAYRLILGSVTPNRVAEYIVPGLAIDQELGNANRFRQTRTTVILVPCCPATHFYSCG